MFKIVRIVNGVGAWGMLIYKNSPICGTLERVYLEEDSYVPKIHDGLWHCHRDFYHKGGYETFEIFIPGHTRILFHKGNWPKDSEGCVLLGESYHDFNPAAGIQDPGLGNSGAAFGEFMTLTKGIEDFFLEVQTV